MDIADGNLYLASDESSYVAGSALIIDGGMTRDGVGQIGVGRKRVLQTGDMAADFTLPSTAGSLTLSREWQDRKVVLAFYIEDNTPG